jgi:hypothetical protein
MTSDVPYNVFARIGTACHRPPRMSTTRHLPALLASLSFCIASGTTHASAPGPLIVHSDNPRWFAQPDGRAVWLTGSHTWAAFQERGIEGRTPDFDYGRYLDFLETHGHNFIRLWIWEHAHWMQFVTADVPVRYRPLAYLRTGPGLALDGKPKFDLTRFDDDFFRRLRHRVAQAGERGMYVGVMFFQGFSTKKIDRAVEKGGNQWHGNPFNKANNINGIDGDPSGEDTGREIHTGRVPALQRIQDAYVRRVIDTLNDLDHVLWEIGNELHAGSVQWQYRMIRFIREYEASKPKQHLIGMTGTPIDTPDLLASPANWISPKGRRWLLDPPAADGAKIVVVDTDHCSPWDHHPDWAWHTFTRGHHFVIMDHYMDFRIGAPAEPNPAWDVTRQAMGAVRRLAGELDLARLTPQPSLASSGFCLANPGREYVAFHQSRTDLQLHAAPGSYQLRWLHPISGDVLARTTAEVGAKPLALTSPRPEGAVLVLVAGR